MTASATPTPRASVSGDPLRVAYLVSRFPHVSETFIAREAGAVAAEGVEVHVRALFPPVDATVHPAARPFAASVRRPSARSAAAATAFWLARRPVTLGRATLAVVAGHRRSPAHLARALATLPLAAAHARELRAARVAHVHAHYATYPALAAWLCRRLTGVPYSFTAHAHDLFVDRSMLEAKVAEASRVVTISAFNRRLLAEHGLVGTGTPVDVVHCGVDVAATPYADRALPATGPVRALCVASLQEYKGHRVLLDALATTSGLERVELDLVGSGTLRAELEARVRALGLADRVRFHGAEPEDRVAARLAAADLFVLPSVVARDGQMEGIPVALMEALAHGVPVVTTRLSGIPELVRDGDTGLLAAPGDPADLGRALLATLADPAGARARAREGRALVAAEFDLRASGRRLAALLREPV